MKRSHPVGLTLVELLVVIAIIGVLVALLLPAIQAAREAARRVQCKNHLKQIALAAITHEQQQGHFPTGGWNEAWVGDKDRGFGHKQPGGWAFNILPFVEESNLYDLAGDGLPDQITDEQRRGAAKLLDTPIVVVNCPSRRAAVAYPHWHSSGRSSTFSELQNAHVPELVGKLDYAINGGEGGNGGNPGPRDLADFWSWWNDGRITDVLGNPLYLDTENAMTRWQNPLAGDLGFNGVSFRISEVGLRHVTDGASNTYLIGEKFVQPEVYDKGPDYFFEDPFNRSRVGGDHFAWCVGFSAATA